MVMNLYLVSADSVNYDEYDAFVVRAESAVRAKKMVEEKLAKWNTHQRWSAKQIKTDGKREIILGSFNAG